MPTTMKQSAKVQPEKRTRLDNALRIAITSKETVAIIVKSTEFETTLLHSFLLSLLHAFVTILPPLTPTSHHANHTNKALILPVSNLSALDTYRSIFTWMLACEIAKREVSFPIHGARQIYFRYTRVYACAKTLKIESLVNRVLAKMSELETNRAYLPDIPIIYDTTSIPEDIRDRVRAAAKKDIEGAKLGEYANRVQGWRKDISEFRDDVARLS